MKKFNLRTLFIAITLISAAYANAQCWGVDMAFGGGTGIRLVGNQNCINYATRIIQLPDGSTLVGGSTINGATKVFIEKLRPNGTSDQTFGQYGKAELKLSIHTAPIFGKSVLYDMKVQADGYIVLCGFADSMYVDKAMVARLKPNGTLDSSFALNGVFRSSINNQDPILNDVEILSDGKILCCGGIGDSLILFRFNSNGTLDNTFNNTGYKIFPTLHIGDNMVKQADGKFIFTTNTRYSFGQTPFSEIVRIDVDGNLDLSFNGTGHVIFNPFNKSVAMHDLLLQSDGKILVSGTGVTASGTNSVAFVARYNANGTLDNTFNGTGYNYRNTTAVQESFSKLNIVDGKILAAGSTAAVQSQYKYMLASFEMNGQVESSFCGDGVTIFNVGVQSDACYDGLIQPDGKLLLTGSSSQSPSQYIPVTRYSYGQATTIEDDEQNVKIALVPNPAQNYLLIRGDISVDQISLFDLSGKQLGQYAMPENNRIDVSGLATGMYIAHIKAGGKSTQLKWMKE